MGRKNRWRDADKDHPKLQELKQMLCRKIVVALNNDQRSADNAAAYLGTSPAVISRIYQERTNQLSLNQLFFFLARLRPFFEILIAATRNG